MKEAMITVAVAKGVPREYAEQNPSDAFMRAVLGKPLPARNDCGYPGRFEFEDNSRMGGWRPEGEGLCDYPKACPIFVKGECPLAHKRREEGNP